MKELLETFTIPQILLFLVLVAIAFKKIADFLDWIGERFSKRDKHKIEEYDLKQENIERFEKIENQVSEMKESINKIATTVDTLMESDKDAIKAWITKEHHYFCYQKGWIDDYSMDCLERRYDHYVEEHGNSFVADLMNEVRDLPKQEIKTEERDKDREHKV